MSSSLNFGANALINKPWRGPWSSTVNYILFDTVSYGGSSWVCIFPNTNVTPGTDDAKWNLLAAKGDSGTVSSVFGRTTSAITAQTGDYTAAQVTNALDMTATRPANKVLAGPTTGADAAPTFRSLVANDVPNIPASKITSGQLALTQGGTAADLSATGGTSQVLKQTSVGGVITVGQLAFTDISGTASTSQIPSLAASKITSGQLALTQGGTGVDLSASGGTTKILAQDASHVISARDLVAADIPSLDAAKITTGVLALARGGTNADLSATGGTSQVLKQTSVGGAVTVAQLAFTDISGSVAASQLPNPSASTLGGIESIAAQSHKWINSISTSGVPNLTQPAAADLSDGTVGSGTHVLLVTTVSGSGTQGVLAVSPNLSGAVLTGTTTLAGTAVPDTAGGEDIGTSALPFANLYIGGSATNNIKITGSATGARTFTLPDANSNPVQPDAGASHNFLTAISSAGVISKAQPAFTDISGTATATQYVTMVGDSGSGGTKGAAPAPSAGDAAAGKFLRADAAWAVPSGGGGGGTPGGNTNDIQFNSAGSFAGMGMLSPAGTILPNLVYKNVNARVTSTGYTDVYTCPSSKRAIACEVTLFNNSGVSISNGFYVAVKIGGVYYQTTASNATAGNNAVTSRSSQYILEAGEILAVNISQQPCNVWVGVMEFDNTSNLKSINLTTFINGDNTVYTVPVGKSAIVLPNTFTPCSGTVGTFFYGNLSGANRTIVFNLVPSGGSAGSTNVIATSASVGGGVVPSPNGSGGTVFTPGITGLTMSTGDFFSVNSDSNAAQQFAYVTVVEI